MPVDGPENARTKRTGGLSHGLDELSADQSQLRSGPAPGGVVPVVVGVVVLLLLLLATSAARSTAEAHTHAR